ncbi:MAG: pilus assembly protein PilM [Candidatus Omnitrophica bacterium]|nr:pilus assembly protein PilM [Candidatus Omnitrophota bacterium]
MKNNGRIYVIDIGNYSLKLLGLERRGKTCCVLSTRIVPLKLTAHDEAGSRTKTEHLTAILKDLFSDEPQLAHSPVSLVLSNNTIFTRFVTLPNIARSKLNQIIRFEVEQQIPFIIDEVTWAYTTIPLAHTSDLSVLIAAIRNNEIEILSTIFKDLGIAIKTFGICHISYYNLLCHCDLGAKNVLLIDLGDEVSSLVFMEKTRTWGRNLLTGGAKLTKQIMTKLNLDLKAAEKLKQQVSLAHGGDTAPSPLLSESSKVSTATEITKEFINDLINEILRSISFYMSTVKDVAIDKIVLTGGTSAIKGLVPLFSERLALPVEKADWRAAVSLAPHLQQKFAQEQHYFGAALGWGLTELNKKALKINLLPQAEKNKRLLKDFRQTFFSFLVLYVFIIIFFSFIFGMKNAIRQEQISQLNNKIKYYEQCAHYEKDIQDELQLYAKRYKIIQANMQKKTLILNAIKVIERTLPDTMWLNAIDFSKEGSVLIGGFSTDTLSDVSYLTAALEKEPLFEKVKIQEANILTAASTQGKAKKTFTISAHLVCDVNGNPEIHDEE